MSKWLSVDWLGAAATVFALAVTFNAEYEIARAVHIDPIVAYAVPGALDVYVLRALQVKRDVFLTVLAMVAVNAASHLVTAGVLTVSPVLIVAVSAIAPLVLWRAHVLRHASTPAPRCTCARSWNLHSRDCALYTPGHELAVPEHAPDACPVCSGHHGIVCPAVPTLAEHAAQAEHVANPGTVNVPEHDAQALISAQVSEWGEDWRDEHDDFNQVEAAWHAPAVPEHIERARTLHLVTDAEPGTLLPGDDEHTEHAWKLYEHTGSVPTLRALKTELSVGTDRARRLRAWIEAQEASTQ